MRKEQGAMITELTDSQSDTQAGVDQFNFVRGINNRLSGNNHENTVALWIIFISLINPEKITSFHKSYKSRYMFWYDSTSIASRLSRSALRLIISISCSSDILSLPTETGKKIILACPVGTSGGTSIVSLWLAGISTVCVILIRKI